MNRLETTFGDDGLDNSEEVCQGNLRAFSALYRFDGRTWGITIWETTTINAMKYCREHGMEYGGRIEQRID